ncbi:MAG: hypothetical protein C0503_01020 [Gemmatimonas sp.]|nr:hypothetical protein [Gemmatimonas sp.]
MRYVGRVAVAGVLLVAASARADDFWLVPNAFDWVPGTVVTVRGQTSSRFPTSRSAVAVDRIATATRVSADTIVPLTDFAVTERSLIVRDRPDAPGQYALAVALHPRAMRETAAGFRRYLELEGADSALARVQRLRLLEGRDSVTRRYAKYAKTLVQVGRGGPRAYDRSAGQVLEFIPLSDPARLRVGDTLRVRAVFRGRPLPGLPVHAEAVPPDASRDATSGDSHGAAEHQVGSGLTDGDGVARFPIHRLGMWSVRAVHIEEEPASRGAVWDAHWVSLVFATDARPPGVER